MQQIACGALNKMRTELGDEVQYFLPLGDTEVHLNPLIGQPVSLHYQGAINCTHCGRKTKKSFSQGYCYPCFKSLPQCDQCIMKPELCHFHEGTCRDASWGEQFCFQDHYVYLANSSGVKVGITRGTQIPTRWIDQGAIEALPILKVSTRLQSGQVEILIGKHVADKTNWRKMLKNDIEDESLITWRNKLKQFIPEEAMPYFIESNTETLINFPVTQYPTKPKSLNLIKTPTYTGTLVGIKGQYLIFEDETVFNVRSNEGLVVKIEI